jgi:CHAD domain-containing protein
MSKTVAKSTRPLKQSQANPDLANPDLAETNSAETKAASAKKAATKQTKKSAAKTTAKSATKQVDQVSTLSLGDFAHSILEKQYHRIVKQEAAVLKDKDPEHLHQMRVATRRLRTGLTIFRAAIQLPKPAREERVQALAKVLGQLRDLDVQMADLQERYRPQVPSSEQALIDQCLHQLGKQRREAFQQVESKLSGSKYQRLQAAYEDWLDQPAYQPVAQISVTAALPDLLCPLISHLLLHPGWWIAATERDAEAELVLHDLRKTCKQARYQTEFFTAFYDQEFVAWTDELKQIQDQLGVLQDTYVLLEILAKQGASAQQLPELYKAVTQQQTAAMADWDQVRARYLDQSFRRSLYQLTIAQ